VHPDRRNFRGTRSQKLKARVRFGIVKWRGLTRQSACGIALAAIAATATAAPATAKVVEPVWVTKQVAVTPGQTKSLILKCPARAVALNGTSSQAASSIPGANARRWTFRFARSGEAVLRCVRLRLPRNVRGISIIVGTAYEPVVEVPPGFTQTIDVRCPTGQTPTGWGLERSGDANGLSTVAAVPTAKGWSFAVENTGATGASGTLNARCLEKKQRARSGQRHTFATRVASFTEQIGDRATTTRSCRSNEYSVATGVSLPPDDNIALTGTSLTGERGAEWTFSQASGATAVHTSLICLAGTTGFRR
jgi:hypothetical protein